MSEHTKDTLVISISSFALGFALACCVWSVGVKTVVISPQSHVCVASLAGDAMICTKK